MNAKRALLLAVALLLCALGACIALGFVARLQYERALLVQIAPLPKWNFPTAAQSQTNTLLLLGDSRIQQWPRIQIDGWNVINAGVGGITSSQLALACAGPIERTRPKVVLVQVGINDLKLLGLRPDLRNQLVQLYASNIVQIVQQARKNGAQTIVTTILPAGRPSLARRFVWSDAVAQGVNEANALLLSALAKQPDVRVVDLFEGRPPFELYSDTLHLRPAAYEMLSGLVSNLVTNTNQK